MRKNLPATQSDVAPEEEVAGDRLGTAQWLPVKEARRLLAFCQPAPGERKPDGPSAQIWIGQSFPDAAEPLAYAEDERHVLLVAGTRGGKGTSSIIPTLCHWPGSCIVVDPKGENAAVTARRRHCGSEYARGLGQSVYVLDPFGEVAALPPALRASFNPLDAVDPASDLAVDDAARIAAALVVPTGSHEPFWEDWARSLVQALILYVLVDVAFEGKRNLTSVWRLLKQGAWQLYEKLQAHFERLSPEQRKPLPSPFDLLWKDMTTCTGFNGVVSGLGHEMQALDPRTASTIVKFAQTNCEFMGSPLMQRCLETSQFKMSEIKEAAHGVTLYLVLPQRYMGTHYRWLRLMLTVACNEMERIKRRPVSGHKTLFLLDEFAGLKRFEVVENAIAQAAGSGLKFFFVLQSLAQLRATYPESWEVLLANCGLKTFFQVDDPFTRRHLAADFLGEREVLRLQHSGSSTAQLSRSLTDQSGTSESWGHSESVSEKSIWLQGGGRTQTTGDNDSDSRSSSWSLNTGESLAYGDGWQETLHKRALLTPDEIGIALSRVEDQRDPRCPGLLICIIPGRSPLLARRANYFDTPWFAGCFDPHPDGGYAPPPRLAEPRPPSQSHPAADIVGNRQLPARPLLPHLALGLPRLKRGLIAMLAICSGLALVVSLGAVVSAVPPARPEAGLTVPSSIHSQAFADGLRDRTAWEDWFTGLQGDFRGGAEFWAGERSDPQPGSCFATPSSVFDRGSWSRGCLAAKARLDPSDARRRREPEYRQGWNSH